MRFVGIDPSTKTGLVILDKHGEIVDTMEITSERKDPQRMVEITEDILFQLEPNDIIAIEGFAYRASGSAISLQYGLGWAMRMGMFQRSHNYIEIAPTQLKKFASGKGNTKKDELAVHIFKRWGFEHPSDNVRDAFVLAQIAFTMQGHIAVQLTKAQSEVIQAIKNPEPKKKKGKVS